MKHGLVSIAAPLTGLALLVVACAGSSFEGSGGNSGAGSGGDSAAGNGGKASAGSSNGGSSSAGKATGGMSSSGAATGGANHGGATTGGATTGGGSGNPRACKQASDCAACNYPTAPTKESECYCPGCGDAPLSKAACTKNQTAWEKSCSAAPIICPAIACVEPPVPDCSDDLCVLNQ